MYDMEELENPKRIKDEIEIIDQELLDWLDSLDDTEPETEEVEYE
jgi:hypothetical protein